MQRLRSLYLLAAFISAGALSIGAGQVPNADRANWKLADRYSPEALRPFIYSTALTPGWINKSGKFWYAWRGPDGVRFWQVDTKAKKKMPLFDTNKMAELLSLAIKKPYDSTNLPISTVTFDEKNDNLMKFSADNIRFEYDLSKAALKEVGRGPATGAGGPGAGQGGGNRGGGGGQGGPGRFGGGDFKNTSPDKKAYVYAQDDNLFYVEVVDGKDQPPVQLTKDGERWYSFGSRRDQDEQIQQFEQQQQNDGDGTQGNQQGNRQRETRVRANVTWSKDSKRFYVTRSDSRKVADLYLVNNLSEPRPTLMTYKYAMPGEVNVPQVELFVFDPASKTLKKSPVEKWKDQRLMDIHWQDGTSDKLRFVRRDRLQRNLELCEMDLTNDKITPLLSESVDNAYLESQNVRYVKPNGDFLWWSERDGWGHYYLYSNDGKLKNQIDSGPFRTERIVELDADKGTIWLQSEGKEPGEDPYYRHMYRTSLDGKQPMVLLDPGNADHSSFLSSDKKFVVDVSSRVDMAPMACLRDDDGKEVMPLENTDTDQLKAAGWQAPERFKVKAADGVTDIYGNMWKPFDFDANKKYPIIANVYPGPQTESVNTGFSATNTNQRLAQLGFIVIQIGNRGGNPARSNAYHSYGYYNLRDYGLADKKAGIEQLAARYKWIDIERVGIYGHSGGGFMTAAALLLPPYNDFFKVGVASSGNHDNNVYNQNWSEQHHGLREVATPPASGGSTSGTATAPPPFDDPFGIEEHPLYSEAPELLFGFPDDPQGRRGGGAAGQGAATQNTNQGQFQIKVPTNAELAANLKGNLFLVHGDMDNNVHHAGTMRLVNALIKANKRFDFLMIPGKPHGYGDMQPYFTERLMEYFAEHLLGDYKRNQADMKINP